MANIQPFLLMTELQAARFREETAGDENRLDPREVMTGPQRGKYVLPERVLFANEFEARRDAFRMLTVVSLDIDEAFPPEPEPDEDA
jgi:hypothetical protein